MNQYLTDKANIVEMIILDHEGNLTKLNTSEAWCYLEINAGVVKGVNVRPDWKDPTPTGKRNISFALTKHKGEKYDGSITLEGKKVAVFRLGRLDDD